MRPTCLRRIAAVALLLVGHGLVHAGVPPGADRVSYNGIATPPTWPPAHGELTREPMVVPYLLQPPAVIPIDVGRQLFVDDFLIAHATLTRTFHRPVPHAGNPVVRPDRPWELRPGAENAAPFSDGVWFDPRDGLFKLWYMAPPPAPTDPESGLVTCLAVSRDGLHWEKPARDVVPGTNIVLTAPRDSTTVWLDHAAADPARRFALLRSHRAPKLAESDQRAVAFAFSLHWSADGIHWSEPAATTGALPWIGDRHTAFYNPFRRAWVFSLRNSVRNDPALLGTRARLYHEHADAGAGLQTLRRHPWIGADRLDPRHPKFPDFVPQLYNLDAVAYESVLLGLFAILQGPENDDARRLGIHKRNEVLVGFSRDGYHWHRPDRRPFLAVDGTDGAWNWGNVQSAGGGCLVVGDRLFFFYSGRRWSHPTQRGGASTGLAFLRRDGFASMDAGEKTGELTTRPVVFSGKHLFVNADTAAGELRVEVLDKDARVITPFTLATCRPVRADGTRQRVQWPGAADLSAIAGRPVRFRFQLRQGRLFAFWVSPVGTGASRGFVAAGGPGFSGPRDE